MIVSRAAGRDAATRQRIAVAALARSTPATRLARRYGTRRKFIGVVREKARRAVEQAFVVPPEMSSEFEAFARVSQARVRRLVLATVLVAHGAYWTARAARWRPLRAASVRPRPRPASSPALSRRGSPGSATTYRCWPARVARTPRDVRHRRRVATTARAFAGVLDDKLAALARRRNVAL
jgi:hypothetical protein